MDNQAPNYFTPEEIGVVMSIVNDIEIQGARKFIPKDRIEEDVHDAYNATQVELSASNYKPLRDHDITMSGYIYMMFFGHLARFRARDNHW